MANPVISSTESKARATGARMGVGGVGHSARIGAGGPIGPVTRLREFIQLQIDRALESGEIELLIAALVAVARRRSEAEGESLKAHIFQQMLEKLDDAVERRRVWPWVRLCAARPESEAREMACVLLDSFWRDHRKDVERLTLNLARDENAGVRQYAAGTMSRIIQTNFRLRFRYLQAWSRHGDPSVRRQVIIATVGVADREHPERAKPLLNMLQPHMADRDPYVRRNLGPFALGQGLLRAYPEATLLRFRQWLHTEDEVVRWNIAIAIAAASEIKHWEAALEVLRVLAADRRRFVWGAAAAALGNLVGQHEREVRPVLRRWMRDPLLRVSVSCALRGAPR